MEFYIMIKESCLEAEGELFRNELREIQKENHRLELVC